MNALQLLALDCRDILRSILPGKNSARSEAPTQFDLFFFSPYARDGNLGKAYNSYMELVPRDEDWVCFYDRDVFFLTPDYGLQIHELILRHPEAGLLTSLTNRIGCPAQLYEGKLSEESDILYHQQIASQLQRHHRLEVQQIDPPVSGFLMVMKKEVWKGVRFSEQRNLLGVDWQFTKRLAAKGYPIYLMKGLYVFHYYRLREGADSLQHLENK